MVRQRRHEGQCVAPKCEGVIYVKARGVCGSHYDKSCHTGALDRDFPLLLKPKPTCRIDGCDGIYASKGLCRTHYARMKRTGSTNAPIRRIDAFWDLVDVRGPTDCWEWQGRKSTTGYGRVGHAYAHRVSCELHYGPPVGEANIARHHCDNPPCVNPAHLAWGTQLENMADMVRRGRQRKKAS